MVEKLTPEEFKEYFERMPKRSTEIASALEQFVELYLAGSKLVFRFLQKEEVEEGIELLVENSAHFTSYITLKDFGDNRFIEIHMPDNDSLFVRISGEKIHNIAMNGFKALPSGPQPITVEFSFKNDAKTIDLKGEVFLEYQAG